MGGFSNFAISFSIISILTGAVILYDYGLAWAGTAAVLIGWPLVTVFVLLDRRVDGRDRLGLPDRRRPVLLGQPDEEQGLGLVDGLAEPHRPVRDRGRHQLRGGRVPERDDHHAAARQRRHRLRQHDGRPRRQLPDRPARHDGHPHDHRADHEHRRHQPRGVAQPGQRLVAHRHRRGRRHPRLPGRQARRVRADAVRDPATGRGRQLEQQPRGRATCDYGPAISYPIVLAFFFSLLQANWTYTGYDASAHVAEETVGARVASAWGLFLSVAVSAVVGFIFLSP